MNKLEQVDFWKARQRRGDLSATARSTGFSVGYVTNMVEGRRTLNPTVANSLYRISRRRTANWILANRRNVSEKKIATTLHW